MTTPDLRIHPVTVDPIAEAARAVEAAFSAPNAPEAMIRLQMNLVRDLASAHGLRPSDNACAAAAILCGRSVVPVLDADLLAEFSDPRVLTPVDAAAITECLGLNTLIALQHRRRPN